MWGWTIPDASAVPDLRRAIDLVRPMNPPSGSMTMPEAGAADV